MKESVSDGLVRLLLLSLAAGVAAGCSGVKVYRNTVEYCQREGILSKAECRKEFDCGLRWTKNRCGNHIRQTIIKRGGRPPRPPTADELDAEMDREGDNELKDSK